MAPVSGEALPSSELIGIDKQQPAPGISLKAEVAPQDSKEAADDKQGKTDKEACPGGDVAAGAGREVAQPSQQQLQPQSQEEEDPTLGVDMSTATEQIVSYEDGSSYIGQTVAGKRHGQGIWQSHSGQYEGEWAKDLQHGKGQQTWSDGRVYNGQFKNGKFSGQGSMSWQMAKGRMTYEGQYLNDLKHGVGKFVWADGRTYHGEWVCGKRHGRGTYSNSLVSQKAGYWVDDKFDHWETDAADKTNGTTHAIA